MMTETNGLTRQERKAKALVDRWFVTELAPADWSMLRDTMRTSRPVRDHYDQVAKLRAHVRPKEVLSDDRLASIATAIFEPVSTRRALPGWHWLWSAGATCAIIMALLVLRVGNRDDGFQVRGSDRSDVGIRAFCVDASERVHQVASVDDAQPTRCALSDTLQLSYTMRNAATERYLFLVGVDEQHRALWYFPTPAEQASINVGATGGNERVLPDSVALSVNHRAGKLSIYGIFTPTPITVEAVRAWSERAPLDTLPAAADIGATSAVVKKLSLVLEP
jgi:hypothetical protein